jgi:hypothetical protein
VSKFVREDPFPLTLAVCESHTNLRLYAGKIISSRGLRFGPTIAKRIEANIAWLRDGGWKTVHAHFDELVALRKTAIADRIAAERAAARTVIGKLGGLAGLACPRVHRSTHYATPMRACYSKRARASRPSPSAWATPRCARLPTSTATRSVARTASSPRCGTRLCNPLGRRANPN